MQNQRIHTNMKKFKGVIYPCDALDDQNLGIKRKGSSVLDSKKPKKARMRQPDKFQTPLNETLSHSYGKVVFDHRPYTYDW